MLLEEILKGEPGVAMGDGTLYRMVINDEQNLHIRSFSEERFFYLYAKVGELPEGSRRAELLESLLESNLFGQESGGSFFSWHRQSNTLVLMATFDTTVATYQQYTSRLQLFVDYVVHWKKKLAEMPESYPREDMFKLMSQNKRIFFI